MPVSLAATATLIMSKPFFFYLPPLDFDLLEFLPKATQQGSLNQLLFEALRSMLGDVDWAFFKSKLKMSYSE